MEFFIPKKLEMSSDDYELLEDAYKGSGGFADGTYLTAHKRETETNYYTRKLIAFYLNYVKIVVDSHVKAVFSEDPVRGDYNDQMIEAFIKDADANGTDFNRWMKRVATKAKLFGCMLVVVDNSDSPEPTIEDALNERQFPYVYYVNPSRIVDYETDRLGRLISVTYSEVHSVKNDSGIKSDQTYYRTWDSVSCRLQKRNGELVGEEYFHNLGVIPCFFFYGDDTPTEDIIPMSDFLQAAKANKAIYNICSEIRESQRHQCFNILTMQGEPPDSGKLKVGTENVLYYPETSKNAPEFIAPDPAPLDKLEGFVDRLIEEIYRMSCVTYTQQYATTQSGESKKWTFHITKQVLVDFSINCEKAENKIFFLFGRYLNKNIEMNVQYSQKYSAEDIDTYLQRAIVALEVGMGSEGNAQIKAKAAREYFSDLEDSEIAKIIDTIFVEKEQQQVEVQDSVNLNLDDNLE